MSSVPPGNQSRTQRHAPPVVAAVDPDVDLRPPAQRRAWMRHRWVLPVIALGGMVGAACRYALELALPHQVDGVPWATLLTNTSGCLLIGMLMVHVVEVGRAHPLLRPFLGGGVLGGYTTFSSVSVQVTTLLEEQRTGWALAYLFLTLGSALVAVAAGVWSARTAVRVRQWLMLRRKARS